MHETEKYITTEELASHLKVCFRTLANWRKQKKIPYVAITPRCFRYKLSEVLAAISQSA